MLITANTQIRRLAVQYRSFMKGMDGATLEEAFAERFEEIESVIQTINKQAGAISKLRGKQRTQFQKMGIVRYDAFQEMGGKLSFVLTLLDTNDTGFILNSMHSQEGCYTYLKEIVKGQSYMPLSEEEAESLEMAINSNNYMEG